MQQILNNYALRVSKYNDESNRLNRYIKSTSWLRVLSFISFIVLIYFFAAYENIIYLFPAATAFILFILLIIFYLRTKNKKRFTDLLLKINKNEIDIIENHNSFLDDGAMHLKQFSYSDDLDLFGRNSLFHIINRCGTIHGKKILTELFLFPKKSKSHILDYQHAVKELNPKIRLRQNILAHALNNVDDPEKSADLKKWIRSSTDKTLVSTSRAYRYIGPALFLLSLLLYFIFNITSALIFIATLNLFVSGMLFKNISDLQTRISKSSETLFSYSNIFKAIQEEDFESDLLKDLNKNAVNANRSFRKLAKISESFDRRMNLIVWVILNGIFSHDLHCVVQAHKWKIQNRNNIDIWLTQLGIIESLNSISSFHYNNPGYSFPEIEEDNYIFKASALGHPLLDKGKMVSNNISLGPKPNVFIVTGSNMSGKSTFLRTLGINLLLARIGAPVCAKNLETYPFEILTSIKLSDSLKENKSLFFIELERLQRIISTTKENNISLVLIDEMLKGTNSDDKYYGSAEFARRVKELQSIFILATHDIKLGKLEAEYPEKVRNYCFESTIENDEISFDYKIREGISRNRNASFLMRKMNIIDN